MIESGVKEDDETTATQLKAKLAAEGVYVSLTTTLCNWRQLGVLILRLGVLPTDKKSKQAEQLKWTHAILTDSFNDVIWGDESNIQLDCHR